ncbi:MAG: hypothetical protein U1C33_07140, partial [Candidatus Cloacimonadaceae bacterium]|nr:hypothetical protein [Candidatus Cloacimonadaceae bacterium]
MRRIDLSPDKYMDKRPNYAEALMTFDVILAAIVMYALDHLIDSYQLRGIFTTLHTVNIGIAAYLLRKKGIYICSGLILAFFTYRIFINNYSPLYILTQSAIMEAVCLLVYRTKDKLDLLQSRTESDIAELQIKEAMIL